MVRIKAKVNWARRRWFGGLGMMGLLMLFSHQNCAPVGNSASGPSIGSSTSSASSSTSDSQPITITDGSTATLTVSFAQPQVQLDVKSGQASVQGICSVQQEGSVLDWKVQPIGADGSFGTELLQGNATCTGGQFEVQLTDLTRLTCGDDYELTAQFGFVVPGQTVLTNPCGTD
jgi:hypothetical protein